MAKWRCEADQSRRWSCTGRRQPVHEAFRVRVDDEDVVRTDHVLRIFAAPASRLHYRLDRLR